MTFNNDVIKKNDVSSFSGRIQDDFTLPGPLVDSGIPYSAIGIVEIVTIGCVLPRFNGTIDAIPLSPGDFSQWQYRTGDNASPLRRIPGSNLVP